MKTMRSVIMAAAALASSSAYAQYTDGVVKIGVLTDMSSIYSDISGSGAIVAAKLAVEDFGAGAVAAVLSQEPQARLVLGVVAEVGSRDDAVGQSGAPQQRPQVVLPAVGGQFGAQEQRDHFRLAA